MPQPLVILGGAGSGVIVAEAVRAAGDSGPYTLIGFLNDMATPETTFAGKPVLGPFAAWRDCPADAMFIGAFPKAKQALARGATVLAEMAGYGITNDATHLSKPDASGQTHAMSNALKEARRHDIAPHDIAYLNAHGTATKVGDKVETDSIKATYGDHATRLPISSTKALHGHLLGAAGVVEFIAAIEAMRHAIAPPTAHLWQADPECDLDYIPLAPRPLHNPRAVMSNSFAFGGSNAVLVAKRVC